MKSKQKTKKIILVLVIIFAISNFSNNTFSDEQDNWNDSVGIQDENNVKNPKKSGAYTESFIHIDGNWTDAIGKGWFSGDGTWGNPYVIENVTIDASSSPTRSGIFISNSKNDYFIIRNCMVYNAVEDGITLENSNNGTLLKNDCSDNGRGIMLINNCINNTILVNTANRNTGVGIRMLVNCNNNTISGNTVCGYWQKYGIRLSDDCHNNTISGNTAKNNGRYGIWVEINCDNNIISGNTAYNSGNSGIYLENNCDNNTISRNTANSNFQYGIYLKTSCNNNIISKNSANINDHYGIGLEKSCYYNNITRNTAYNNREYGIYLLTNCDNNIISGNLIKENQIDGVFISEATCENNLIYQNSLKGNVVWHARDSGTNNHWNNTNIGNYWDNHTTPDSNSDGIVDTPYTWIIGSANSIDSFPLTESPVHDGEKIHIDDSGVNAWDWSDTARLKTWCSGSGTYSDPYIIEDLEVDGAGGGTGILIENSNVFFKIKDCKVYNCTDGIRLEQTDYGSLTNNNCFNSTNYQIWLKENCHNNIISGNTINFSGSYSSGIVLEDNCDDNSILENIINGHTWFGYGIRLQDDCDNNIIVNNIISKLLTSTSTFLLAGIYLRYDCIDNIIANNTLTKTMFGIWIAIRCNDNVLINNTLKSIPYCIYIDGCHNITLSGNMMDRGGIRIEGGPYSHYSSHKIYTNNTINGRNVYYYVEKDGLNGSNFTSAGQVILIRCNNSIISNLNLSKAFTGLFLYNSHDNKITNNTANNNEEGIYLHFNCDYNIIFNNTANYCGEGIYLRSKCNYNNITENNVNNCGDGIYLWSNCDYNNITGNTANNNYFYGIFLRVGCDHNNITGNTVNNNDYCGIYLNTNCNYNNITENTANNNGYYVNIWLDLTNGGICISDSNNNFIWNNSFIGNTVNANDTGIINYWNITEIGNYWDDYSGVDANDDGIGDTPYNIPGAAGSQDFLPTWWDAPVLNVTVPSMNQKFGSIVPTCNISIVQGLGDYFWCEFIGTGKIMNLTKLNGVANENISVSLNQTIWSSLPYGRITIRFYCNDTRGYIGYLDVEVIKEWPYYGVNGDDDGDDDEKEEIEFLGPTLIIIGITSAIAVAAVAIYLIRKRRLLRE